MKLQLLSSAALVLLSAVGAVSEDLSSAVSQPAQSGSGIARAVSGEISVLDYEGEEFSTSPDDPNFFTSPDDSSEDIFDEDEEMEEVDHNGGRARAYRKGARRGYDAGRNGRRVNGKERAYARGAARGYHAGRNGPEYRGGRSRAYRRGATRGYHAGRRCRGKCDEESEIESYGSYDQYPEDFESEDADNDLGEGDLDREEEMEEVDHNGGRARAYRKGARRGYNAGHNGRRVNGKERAYARGAVRGYHAGRNGPEYGGGRSRAYRRGAARGYHAGRRCNGKCDDESKIESYDSYDQYPDGFEPEDENNDHDEGDLNGEEEMEEVDHNGGRARAYRKGARRGYDAGHNGRRVNGKERAYARGAARGYQAGRNGPEYRGGRSRAYRRGAARGYHAGRHCNGKCDGESEKSYDSYDQYPEDFDSEDVDEEDVMVATK